MRPTRTHIAILILLAAIITGFLIPRRETSATAIPAANTSADPTRSETTERQQPETPTEERMQRDAIEQAAQKWYESQLEKYPDLRPAYRNVPDERNGYLQLIRFAESYGKTGLVPSEFKLMFAGDSPWDSAKAGAWLTEISPHFERLLYIAELPDRSSNGISFALHDTAIRHVVDYAGVLRASARIAIESGDREKALRHLKASASLTDHLTDIEAPNMVGEIIATGARRKAQESFRQNILPHLDPDSLSPWNDALFRKEPPASEYSRIIKGSWNFIMKEEALRWLYRRQPFHGEIPTPDLDGFAASYARSIRNAAAGASSLGPDRFVVASAKFADIPSGLDPDTTELLRQGNRGTNATIERLARAYTQSRMEQAAIAALSGNQMPLDPISGKPFHWNPATRTLTAPEGTDGIDPIKVP